MYNLFIDKYLQQVQMKDYLELVKAFRGWVRSNLIAVAWNY